MMRGLDDRSPRCRVRVRVKRIILHASLSILHFSFAACLYAQQDTIRLREAEVIAVDSSFGSLQLRGVEGTAIHVAKKNEVLVLGDIDANKALNNARQVYARVPGLNIQESDPGGLQLSVAARGLDPHRTSNFNLRQNGHDISADALGYPEAYYTPPMEAVERIEVLRGAASLQYGPQFGGLINFRMAPAYRGPIEFRTVNTVGSYGLFDTYNRLSGTRGRSSWILSYDRRSGESWRPNSAYTLHHGYASFEHRFNDRTRVGVQYTLSRYLAQQPGGLSDAQFRTDPSVSLRSRNWFATDWNILAITAGHRFSQRSELDLLTWGFLGSRDALGLVGDINRLDDPDTPRDLIHDDYRNMGAELRYLRRDSTSSIGHIWLVGTRLYQGLTRKAQGFASAGNDSDMRFTQPDALEGSDYDFPGRNVAFFAEDVIGIGQRLRVVPGARFEWIDTRADGYYRRTLGTTVLPGLIHEERQSARHFLLLGLGVSYRVGAWGEVYGNFSQNYRGITFTDMRITRVNQLVDPDLKDERGHNIDVGWRGRSGNWLRWDLSGFLLRYEDRIGQIQWADAYYNIIRYTTNVGASTAYGGEFFVECDLLRLVRGVERPSNLAVFASVGLLDARYTTSPYPRVEGNYVEFSPPITARGGITYRRKRTSITVQGAYTEEQYTEASNATFTPNAVNGLISAYHVFDASAKQGLGKHVELRAGVNNALDRIYFTRRASGYPGPGIIPAERRVVYVAVAFNIGAK